MTRLVLEPCGLTLNDFKPAYLSFSESVTAIKDNTVDAGVIAAGYPVASLLDLSRHVPIRLISYTKEELDSIFRNVPYLVNITIPGGTYTGISSDTQTHGSPAFLACRQDMSEDLVYCASKSPVANTW